MNIVPIGIKPKVITTTLTSVSTSAFGIGDIISNDKVAINDIMDSTGESVRLKRVSIYIYDSAGSPSTADMDVVIFKNLATTTLGLSSNDVFLINANNLYENIPNIAFASTDFDTVDTNIEVATKAVDFIITPSQSVSNSLSFALVSRGTPTFTATHTIKVIFEVEQL